MLASCSVFPDSPPQVGAPQDSGTDSDADLHDAPGEADVSIEADAPQEADVSIEADATDDAIESGDADGAADAIESGDVQSDAPDHCFDAETNFDETDLNCGGLECPKCGKGKSCLTADDCKSGSCKSNKKCE